MVIPRARAHSAHGRTSRHPILVDPSWMGYDGGFLAEHVAQEDHYFTAAERDSALGLALDRLVDGLPADERDCLEMRVHGRYSFGQIARHMDWWVGDPPYLDRKKVWRHNKRALERLRALIGSHEWLSALAPRPEVLEVPEPTEDDV